MYLHTAIRLIMAGTLLSIAPAAHAGYPCQRVTLVIPFGAGQASGASFAIAEQLRKTLGVPVVSELHPGAGGSIGTSLVVRARGDGCTLLFGAGSPLILPFTKTKPYDAERDLRAVAFTVEAGPPVLVARDGTIADFAMMVDRARAHPGTLNVSVNGRSLAHLAGLQLFARAGVAVQFIPFNGENDAFNQLLGGHVDLAVVLAPTAVGHINAGSVRALAQVSSVRNHFLPDVPSMADVGMSGVDFRVYNAIMVPATTPDATIDFLEGAIKAAQRDPEFIAQLAKQASVPLSGGPEEVSAWLKRTTAEWTRLVDENHLERE